MESLGYIYLAIMILAVLELIGFAIYKWTKGSNNAWPLLSAVITAVVIATCLFELEFIGVNSLFGAAFIAVPIFICLLVTWKSVALHQQSVSARRNANSA